MVALSCSKFVHQLFLSTFYQAISNFGHISSQLPPAPPPPPYPEGYVPPSASEEKAPDDLLASEALPPVIDPIIDQGPAKRPRFQ
jgi:hypothetical protein